MCSISCTIELENGRECYRPGEAIKGLVVLDISGTNNVLLKAVALQFSGFAHTKWEMAEKLHKSRKGNSNVCAEYREDYVSTKNYLIGSEMAHPKPIEPGIYNYNFIINVPQNIPSTFDSPLGFIRYNLTVNADYGDHVKSLQDSSILIEQLKDLRLMDPALQLPAEAEQLEHKSFTRFWHQPLQLYISVPQKAFTAGESISVYIKLTNPSQLKIHSITSNLNRKATYKGLLKEKVNQKTQEITTIATNKKELNGKNIKLMQLVQDICIPQTPNTITFEECKCISVEYELEVLVECQNQKRWVKAIIPILMGSISLRSDRKYLPLNFHKNKVPAITVARSMEELTLPSALDLQGHSITSASTSMSSLASSFKEADFMAAVHLNKKSKHRIVGDLNDYKPKYLYYDLPEELQDDL